MHEEPICQWLMDVALEKAQEANASKIRAIYVSNGQLSGALSVHVEFYFRFLSKGTIAEGASIFFVEVPAELRCRNCDTIFSPENLSNVTCPTCKEQKVEIMSGRDLYVDSVEVDLKTTCPNCPTEGTLEITSGHEFNVDKELQ